MVRSLGRAFPVETRWLERPLPAGARLVPEAARLILQAEAETRGTGGTILAFLPGGQAEMIVIAIIAGADLAYVVSHHLLRIVLVILLAPIVARLFR
mgnify:CR=1 FL=1